MRQKTYSNHWILLTGILFMFTRAEAVEKQRIVFLGDSLTAGYSLDSDLSFPSLIQQRIDREGLPFTVVNSGISGDTTAGGLRRLNWLMKQPVSIMFIALGANDGLRGFAPAVTRSNLTAIITTVKTNSPDTLIILAGMKLPFNMGTEYVKSFESTFREVAAEYDIPFLPFLLEGVAGQPEMNLQDGIHPNAAGHEKIAKLVWPYLEPVIRFRVKTLSEQSTARQQNFNEMIRADTPVPTIR